MSSAKVKPGKVILLFVPNKDYSNKLFSFIKKLSPQLICYVTTNKSYDTLIPRLKQKKIDINNMFFIDCVTKAIVEPKSSPKNVVFISSPKDLTAISLAVAGVVKKYGPLIIVDSISTLAVYHSENVLMHFCYDLISKAGLNSSVCLILSVAEEDRRKEFAQKIEMKADDIIRLK